MDAEKTMRFILEIQAKREVSIQQADERFASFREQTEERFRNLVDVTMSLARRGEEADRRINETNRLIRKLNEETNRRFQETDYKLNAFIGTVDKLIMRNGSH